LEKLPTYIAVPGNRVSNHQWATLTWRSTVQWS